jgi:hypothetical protein
MMRRCGVYHLSTFLWSVFFLIPGVMWGQNSDAAVQQKLLHPLVPFRQMGDSTRFGTQAGRGVDQNEPLLNAWGVDILISDGGFGLGGFYRREFTEDLFGFVSIAVSESKDDREVEQYDPYYQISYVPGKLNRFFTIPVMFGIQERLFREDILDTFRPYVNAGIGPNMIFVSPFTEITGPPDNRQYNQVEFFKSLGKGQMHYTAGGFIGVGANFGSEKASLFGVNFRYYFTYLFSGGLPSLFNVVTGDVSSTKSSFGGFFITLNVGTAY